MALQVYAEGGWVCPVCGHSHSKSHYSLPDQIDHTKRPDEKGRVVFNRRRKDDTLDYATKINHDAPATGDSFDEEGYQRPLYCPHCGYEDEFITIKKVVLREEDKLSQFLEERPGGRSLLRQLLDIFDDWREERKG